MKKHGTSLAVQWLRLHTPNARGPGSTPGQGTRSHMLQLRLDAAKQKYFFFLQKLKTWVKENMSQQQVKEAQGGH